MGVWQHHSVRGRSLSHNEAVKGSAPRWSNEAVLSYAERSFKKSPGLYLEMMFVYLVLTNIMHYFHLFTDSCGKTLSKVI